ncbi:hypothetical protein HD554DRAFT_1764599 [Boletus coccyginus]|nr:hypothetical protein HD554DRAFT_1764599 [Boletus coccyginus]
MELSCTFRYGHDCNFAFLRYGEHRRLCRRMIHQSFRAEASLTFRPMQLRRVRQMILNMIDDPEEYPFHYSSFSAAIAMSSVYNYEIKPRNDPIVSIISSFLHLSFPALTPEKAAALKHASITAIIGFVETTSSIIMPFTLATVKNPRVWKRAQAEIDAVVGTDRLPEFEHRNSLPMSMQSFEKHFDGSPLVRWVSRMSLQAVTFTTASTYQKGQPSRMFGECFTTKLVIPTQKCSVLNDFWIHKGY